MLVKTDCLKWLFLFHLKIHYVLFITHSFTKGKLTLSAKLCRLHMFDNLRKHLCAVSF